MFKSKAQKRKLEQLVKDGKVTQDTFNEWNKSTGTTKLPEKAGKIKIGKIKTIK